MAQKKVLDETEREAAIPSQEKTSVKSLLSKIDRAKTLRKTFDTKTLPAMRRKVWGTVGESGEQEVRTNLIFATIATLMPSIYAKNPEISVAPTEAVGEGVYEEIKEFCKTCEVMLNNLFIEEAGLKARAKSAARSAMTTSIGWVKMIFQESFEGDPLQVRRANDTQDNLAAVERLLTEKKDTESIEEAERKREELKIQMQSLMQSPEIRIYKGFTIDRVQTENVFILDESIIEFDDYKSACEIAQRQWMTAEDYEEKFRKPPSSSAKNFDGENDGPVTDAEGNPIANLPEGQRKSMLCVWEVWNKKTNMITTVCEGEKGYARPPFSLTPASERWYPFYAVGFNIVEGRFRPLSDVELLTKLQDEYNTTRYLFAETRKESIPVRIFRKAGGLTQEDIEAITNRRSRQMIGVEGNPSVPISQDVMQLDGIRIDPTAFDVTMIRNDMDMMVGLSDASRSNLIQAKTATEAEIMRQALMTRVAERQDHIEDVISEMARSALEIMLQKFDEAEVKQIAGSGAVWPQMSRDDIFKLVRVSVRAGSSGKPNIMKERETWAQIMPIMNDTITQVQELRAAGQFDLANSKIELLKETLARYDEKIDVDRFVPRQEMDENGQPMAEANAMQQAAQMQEQMQLLKQEYEQCQQDLQACQAELERAKLQEQAKIADAQQKAQASEADAFVSVEESRAKAVEAEAQAAIKAAQETAKTEQARIDAETKAAIEADAMRQKLEHDKELARIKSENDMRIAVLNNVMAALKPQPTVGEDGKTKDAGQPDIDTMLKVAQRVAGLNTEPVSEEMERENSNAQVLQAINGMMQMLAQHIANPPQRSAILSRNPDGTVMVRTVAKVTH